MENRRLCSRLLTYGKGNFLNKGQDIFGSISLNNYSRKGFQASFNTAVETGSDLVVEINLPSHDMPLRANGRVVWTKTPDNNTDSRLEAGIELNDMDLLNIEQIVDECHKDKYLEQAADYAFEAGIHARKSGGSFLKSSCGMPAIFILFFLFGSFFTVINQYFAFIYALTLSSYFLFIVVKKRSLIFSRGSNIKSLSQNKTLLRIAGITLNNLCCGFYFLLGFAAQKK